MSENRPPSSPPSSTASTRPQARSRASTRLTLAAAGARDIIPMLIGAAPFGVIFGTLVTTSPMRVWYGQWMSLTVFAGASQFIGIGLVTAGAGLAVICATTLIVNLRHMLYAATLLPYLKHLPRRWRALLGFLLTDEVFAVSYARLHREPGARLGHWYMLGAGLAMYATWQASTLAGLLFGTAFPGLQSWGLDFAMVATFIAIVVPQLNNLPSLAAALSAGALAFFWKDWPYKLGLMAAVAAGIAIGMLMARNRPPAEAPHA